MHLPHSDSFILLFAFSLLIFYLFLFCFCLPFSLRSNVIKAGLRKINLAYSSISLSSICSKLNLGSVLDAEYMVSKAIHDGVIDAVIDRSKGIVLSRELSDVYATNEPQSTFHKRIAFTMDIHQAAVKSLRYPQQ